MMRKNFSFRWVHPNIHQTVETFGVVITTVHNIKGTNRVALTLNPGDPFPALLRYGCQYKVREEHRLNPPGQLHQAALQDHLQPTGQTGVLLLDRPILQRPGDPGLLLNAQIDQKVLRPAQTRIKESEADVWFDYKFIRKTPKKGQKPKADTIILFIHARNPQELRGDQQQQYSFVYRWVYGALSYPSDNTPVALDKILKADG